MALILKFLVNLSANILKCLFCYNANDTVIFGTSVEEIQHNLNVFYEYSETWKLDIKFDKTKI